MSINEISIFFLYRVRQKSFDINYIISKQIYIKYITNQKSYTIFFFLTKENSVSNIFRKIQFNIRNLK